MYRADSANASRDLRLMTLVHTKVIDVVEPDLQPTEIVWTDIPLPGLVNYFYRIIAIDKADNISEASILASNQAFDEEPPILPELLLSWNDNEGVHNATAIWTSEDQCLLQRRTNNSGLWMNISNMLSAGTHNIVDTESNADETYQYRLRVRKETGAIATGDPVILESINL